jgi:Ca-activated chloride channel homolog
MLQDVARASQGWPPAGCGTTVMPADYAARHSTKEDKKMQRNRAGFVIIVTLAVVVVGVVLIGRGISSFIAQNSPNISKPNNAIEVQLIYAPEEELYITQAITDFNRAMSLGNNPVTGKALVRGERPIWISGRSASSGTAAQGVINAIIAPNNTNVEKPVIFSPSVRHWLALVNYQTGQPVFDVGGAPATAKAPVVMAIWESRLSALKARHPGQDIGWQELFGVFNAPNGWQDYGIQGRQTVYYGHTDPLVSSTALSTLISEFYAGATYGAGVPAGSKLSTADVNNPKVQEEVRKIEGLIKHYSARTTEFKEYIAQGPEYLDFVALEENDLIYINQGKTQYKPPEKLVALYPKEGTFWHDHPFAIPNAPWVSEEQRAGAKLFTDYVLGETVQKRVLESGFRPVNPAVPIGYPIAPELGVNPADPKILPVPDPAVIAAVQQSWQLVKKQADVVVLVDTSGSMRKDDKIGEAREAIKGFLEDQSAANNIGLIRFSQDVETLVPIAGFESNRNTILNEVEQLQARGDTALYDALLKTIDEFTAAGDNSRIRAIVLLSDGQDTASIARVGDVVQRLQEVRNSKTPILVIPIAYGADADINALNAIARASDTKVQPSDEKNIQKLLDVIGSYF